MRGTHRVQIQNKRVRYEFELRRNLTVLRGDSATGKTTLVEMVQEYMDNGDNSSVALRCDKPCYVISGATWRGQLSEMRDSIVFIDEGNPFVFSDAFSEAIQKTDNYYVIVSREGLPNLPYSVTEIYGIRTSGKYGGIKQHYHEFYRIYGENLTDGELHPGTIITEDSHSGFQFFQGACSRQGIACITSRGKSNILQEARMQGPEREVLLIADGAAFGSEMDRVMKYLKGHKNIRLYLPESFEWLVLSANPLKDTEIPGILDDPQVDPEVFFSWERFFTRLLTDRTHGTWLQYSKGQLNPNYLTGSVREMILKQIPVIRFERLK